MANKLKSCRRKRDFQVLATLKQVQGDKRDVIPNLFRNRQIEADKLKSCRRKRDFQALAALNQVQGDEMVALSSELFWWEPLRFSHPTSCAKVGWE